MTQARKHLISIDDTPYYHVVSRCVRRAFLCGTDQFTGQSYEHRRQWIEDRIRLLSSIFAIDICAYAVMSNHLHIVVKLCPETLDNETDRDILQRWCCLFKGPLLVQHYLNDKPQSTAEMNTVTQCASVYRQRLSDLSWFMKCLNQPIARMANQEDNCTGHFWEGRFKSQALLTETALLSCMAYVDLNPIRANMTSTPETSDHTSIKARITPTLNLEEAIVSQIQQHALMQFTLPLKPLWNFDNERFISPIDYLALVDITGRAIRADKRGVIAHNLPPILKRLAIDIDQWLINTQAFEHCYQQHFAKRRQC